MNAIESALKGFIIGDALGVPVEFKSRNDLTYTPVLDMREYGTHQQPKGTWSDDTSMMLATMDSLIEKKGIVYEHMMHNFVKWLIYNHYTPFGEVFDCGNTTRRAIIHSYHHNVPATLCGLTDKTSNGNGSLMRMLPIALYLYATHKSFDEVFEASEGVSSLTHGHYRSIIACGIYNVIVYSLLEGHDLQSAIDIAMEQATRYYGNRTHYATELQNFKRLPHLNTLKREDIYSTGYVVATLEAALWSVLTSDGYTGAVLKAVNLGHDTDTVAAVAGGIAGLLYEVPERWVDNLQRLDYINLMIDKFYNKFWGDE